MPRVIAIVETRYASKTYLPDNEFEVTESDAAVLKAIGKVRDVPVRKQPIVSKSVPQQKVEVPAPIENATLPPPVPVRRRYLRRDLRPQE